MVSKNSNIMTRKKCATCENHEVKADLEPCKSCIKLKDGTKFMNYKQSLEKEITWKSIEMGYITDEELDAYARFSEHEKKIIKEMYAKNPKGTFPNPICALY